MITPITLNVNNLDAFGREYLGTEDARSIEDGTDGESRLFSPSWVAATNGA